MPVDVRREMAHIIKEYEGYYRVIGEEVIWFRFDTLNSRWNDVYDEGGRRYLPATRIPALWVDQIEDPEQYSGEGRRPRQRFRFAVSAEEMRQRGIGAEEAHGRRLNDVPPGAPVPAQAGRPLGVWLDDRLNDVVYYDNRYYSISNFQIRGRAQFADAIVGISALELIPDDESVFDFFPVGSEGFGPPVPPPDTIGSPLVAFTGQDNEWTLSFGSASNMSGSTWTLTLYEDGTSVGTMVVDATAQATGELTVTLAQALADSLGPGEYQWNLIQQFGVASELVMEGTVYLVDSFTGSIDLTILGENFPEVELQSTAGLSAVWSFYFGVDMSGSTWAATLEDQTGELVTAFTVDSRAQDTGLIVVLLPQAEVDALTVGGTYRWKLIQTLDHQPPLLVASGPFSAQEA